MNHGAGEDAKGKIARAIAAELGEQGEGEPFELGDDLTLAYLDQGEVDFGKVADAVLTALSGRGGTYSMTTRQFLWMYGGWIIAVALLLAGCQRVDAPSAPRGGTTEKAGPAPPTVTPITVQMDLVADPDNGCQYWISYKVTPRMAWGASGMYQVGCQGTVTP